jgi:MFS family permease
MAHENGNDPVTPANTGTRVRMDGDKTTELPTELPTLHEQLEVAGWGKFQRTALMAFLLFVVSEGMEVMVPNVVWGGMHDMEGKPSFGPSEQGHSSTFRAIVTGAPMLGNIVGGLVGGCVADTYGRHVAINMHSGIFVLASLASGLSQDETSFVVSRMALGMSLGIVIPVIVSWMAEITPSAKRARAVVMIPGFGIPCGQIVMLIFGLLMHKFSASVGEYSASVGGDADESWWRVMLVAGIVPNLIGLLIVRMYVPESPHFLLSTGNQIAAERVVLQIAQVNGTEDRLLNAGRLRVLPHDDKGQDETGSSRYGGVRKSVLESNVERWRRQSLELLSPPLHLYMLLLLSIWMFAGFGQIGSDIILPKMLEGVMDLDMEGRLTALLLTQILAWPAFILVIFLLEYKDEWSRRTVCMSVAAASAGAALVTGVSLHEGLLSLIISSIFLKMLAHCTMASLDLYAVELLPCSHRATGLAIANGGSKAVGVLVAFFALSTTMTSGGSAGTAHYIIFAAAFAAAATILAVSPQDGGSNGQLIIDYSELCAAHDSNELGYRGEKEGRIGGVPSYGAVSVAEKGA